MEYKSNLKRKLSANDPALVVNINHASSTLAYAVAGMGVDAVLVDCEHGLASPERVHDICRMVEARGVQSIVRPESQDRHLITRYADAGARGFMVPSIDSAQQAAAAVDAIKSVWYKDPDEIAIILMIETVTALENLDEILATPGVDAFIVGPDDLSQSMGRGGDYQHPEIVGIVNNTLKKIVASGRVAGAAVYDGNVSPYYDLGCRYLYCHADTYLGQAIGDVRAKLDTMVGNKGRR